MNNSLSHLTLLFLITLFSFNSDAQSYIPRNSYFDTTSYVEYRAGNLPIIFSAPHGGSLEPDSLPDRTCNGCVTIKDS